MLGTECQLRLSRATHAQQRRPDGSTKISYIQLLFTAAPITTVPYRVCSVWCHCDVRVC